MIAAMGVVEVATAVVVVTSAMVGLFVLVEKLTGVLGRWFQRQHREAAGPIDDLVRYHLGPNGDTPALWRRVARVEAHLDIDDPV